MHMHEPAEFPEGEIPEITSDPRSIDQVVDFHLKAILKLSNSDPKKAGHVLNLLSVYLTNRWIYEAEKLIDEAVNCGVGEFAYRMYGDFFAWRSFLGEELIEGYRTLEEAISAFTHLAETDPIQGNHLLGRLFEDKGNTNAAIQYYLRSFKAEEGDEEYKTRSRIALTRVL